MTPSRAFRFTNLFSVNMSMHFSSLAHQHLDQWPRPPRVLHPRLATNEAPASRRQARDPEMESIHFLAGEVPVAPPNMVTGAASAPRLDGPPRAYQTMMQVTPPLFLRGGGRPFLDHFHPKLAVEVGGRRGNLVGKLVASDPRSASSLLLKQHVNKTHAPHPISGQEKG